MIEDDAAMVVDASGYVRRARRLADLSQRGLAAKIGVDQSQIARIEVGRDVDLGLFERILAAAGLRITVVDENGNQVSAMPRDVLLDAAGRRQPAHLDVHTALDPPTMAMLLRYADGAPRFAWHSRRKERDRRRAKSGRTAFDEQLTLRALASRRPYTRIAPL